MNKTVLILGGTGGIGAHFVRQFAEAGWNVVFTYLGNKNEAVRLEEKYKVKGWHIDATEEKEIQTLIAQVRTDYLRLDALIYAIGIFEDALTEKMELESWNKILSVNLSGAFLVTKHALPLLRESGCGRILYIGSVMGESGCYGSSSYSVTKAGLIALAKSVALENAKKNVTANVLSFGYIDTGMTAQVPDNILESAMKKIPMRRLGDPSDMAKIAVDLCSEHMNYLSGQTIRVNGGLYV